MGGVSDYALDSALPQLDANVKRRERPCLVLLDGDLNVLFGDHFALKVLVGPYAPDTPVRLPVDVAVAVKCADDDELVAIRGNLVRISRWTAPNGNFTCLSVERRRREHDVPSATKRYGLTPRQAEVLALLCQGLSSSEISLRLSISKATLADHIKALREKTNSRNRSDLLTKILR